MRALHALTEAHYNVSARSSLSVRISCADEIEVLAISRKSLSQSKHHLRVFHTMHSPSRRRRSR